MLKYAKGLYGLEHGTNIFHRCFFQQLIIAGLGDKSPARFHDIYRPLFLLAIKIWRTMDQDKMGVTAANENAPAIEILFQSLDVHPPTAWLVDMQSVDPCMDDRDDQLPEAPKAIQHDLQSIPVSKPCQQLQLWNDKLIKKAKSSSEPLLLPKTFPM